MINHIITSTVLILFLLLLSVFLEKRLDPCLKYALWLLAVIKLLVPLPDFETHISVLNVVKQPGQGSAQYLLIDNGASPETDFPPGTDTGADLPSSSGTPVPKAADLFTAIWLCGILLCGGTFLRGNIRFRKWLRRNRNLVGTYKDRLPIYEADEPVTPCLIGIFAPAVYINRENQFDRKQLSYILEHEYTHFRHGDHIWAAVRCLCVAIYWYNPFVWLAARRSASDGELACDAGTLKRIGEENNIEYGKTLILAAKSLSLRNDPHIPGFRTSAAGGMKEMKRRINLLKNRPRTKIAAVMATIILCGGMIGCTYGNAVDEDTTIAPVPTEPSDTALPSFVPEPVTETELQTAPAPESVLPEGMIYHETALYSAPDPDQVCIIVEPSEMRDYLSYYYIPSGDAQNQLKAMMDGLELTWQRDAVSIKEMKITGYQLYYQDRAYRVFEGGYLTTFDVDAEQNVIEAIVHDEKLCSLAQQLLSENLGYEPVDITQIRDIVSARLDVRSIFTDWEFYSQTITDKETLALFGDWFRGAEYIGGGVDCCNDDSSLELTLSNGEVVRLSIASDSCSIFGVNGIYYDFRPETYWSIFEFYQYFDEIPWNFK